MARLELIILQHQEVVEVDQVEQMDQIILQQVAHQIQEVYMAAVVEVNRMMPKAHPDVMAAVEQFALFGQEQQGNFHQQIQVIYRRKQYVILN
jgi:hypothetical protein